MRTDRKFDETRTVKITDHYLMSPQGSVLIGKHEGDLHGFCRGVYSKASCRDRERLGDG